MFELLLIIRPHTIYRTWLATSCGCSGCVEILPYNLRVVIVCASREVGHQVNVKINSAFGQLKHRVVFHPFLSPSSDPVVHAPSQSRGWQAWYKSKVVLPRVEPSQRFHQRTRMGVFSAGLALTP